MQVSFQPRLYVKKPEKKFKFIGIGKYKSPNPISAMQNYTFYLRSHFFISIFYRRLTWHKHRNAIDFKRVVLLLLGIVGSKKGQAWSLNVTLHFNISCFDLDITYDVFTSLHQFLDLTLPDQLYPFLFNSIYYQILFAVFLIGKQLFKFR